MEYRKFGRTGHKVSVISLGGCGVGILSQEEADAAIELAINKYGINTIDAAPSYGESEIRFCSIVEKRRKQLFITEKTTERTYEGAKKELHESLRKIGTEYFDVYQFHAVGSIQELDQIFSEKGAMKAFLEAKDTGLINHIGITGHKDIRVHMEALNRFDFDSILLPVTVASMTNLQPDNDFRPILKIAQEREIAVLAIKSIMKRRWESEKTHSTWYQPLENEDEIQKAVWYTLS
ncbi:MAG: aldo/keto reductase, partial [Candidatus Kariarchaeaceae archaeon]